MLRRRIDELGRIVVPQSMRQALGLVPGTEIDFVLEGKHVLIRAAHTACKVCGSITDVDEGICVCQKCIQMIKVR